MSVAATTPSLKKEPDAMIVGEVNPNIDYGFIPNKINGIDEPGSEVRSPNSGDAENVAVKKTEQQQQKQNQIMDLLDRKSSGRASTILTSSRGLLDNQKMARRTLLGG